MFLDFSTPFLLLYIFKHIKTLNEMNKNKNAQKPKSTLKCLQKFNTCLHSKPKPTRALINSAHKF